MPNQEAALCPLLHAHDLDLCRREAERKKLSCAPTIFQWKGTDYFFFWFGGDGGMFLYFLLFVCCCGVCMGGGNFKKQAQQKESPHVFWTFKRVWRLLFGSYSLEGNVPQHLKTLIRISAACVEKFWAAEDVVTFLYIKGDPFCLVIQEMFFSSKFCKPGNTSNDG